MNNKINHVDDRSRNGSNTATSPKREIVTLMKAVEKTAGTSNHANGYSIDVLANIFRKNYDFAEFIICYNDDEIMQVNQLFERVTDCLDFVVYLQRKVAERLKGMFTAEQLACIFQAYKGNMVTYAGKSTTLIKDELFDFIDQEGKAMYDIGNPETFKAKIGLMNDIEYEVFVNLILEIWGIEGDMMRLLHNFLKSDDGISESRNLTENSHGNSSHIC